MDIVRYSLRNFALEALRLKKRRDNLNETDEDGLRRYMAFVLTGRHPDQDEQAIVDVLADQISPDDVDILEVLQDFDSLNGVSEDLPFVISIAVYPVPRFEDTLKKDCMLTCLISNNVCAT
jgi:hypothetical protein